jgi:hypothetical protein
LKKLVFSGSDFSDICQMCPKITELVVDIDSVATRNTIVLSKLLQYFPHLKTLKLERQRSALMENRKVIFTMCEKEEAAHRNKELPSSFTTLESLSLTNCNIAQDVNFFELNRLKQLRISECSVERDICLGPAIEQFICNLVSNAQNSLHIDIQTKQLSHFECNRPLDYQTLCSLISQKRLNTLILPSAPFSYVIFLFFLFSSLVIVKNKKSHFLCSVNRREKLQYLLTKQLSLTNFQARIDAELDTALMCQFITRWPRVKFSQRRLDFASQFPQVTTEQFIK